jgi:hypothetical protein
MTEKRTEIEVPFRIDSGGSVHYLKDYKEMLNEFRDDNRNKKGVVIYRIDPEKTQHYQHKYYRGYVVPPFAQESFGMDEDEAHDFLKEKFLFYPVSKLSDIPHRFKEGCNKYYHYSVNKETGEEIRRLVGFTPSTAKLTKDEFKEFITKSEMFTWEITGTGLDKKKNNEATHYRNLALEIEGDDPEQSSLFEDGKSLDYLA